MSIRLRRPNPAVSLLSAALACAALGACQNANESTDRSLPAENWLGPQLKAEPQVELAEYQQDVRFAPGTASFAPGTEQALTLFLGRVGAASGDRVYVVASAPEPSASPEARNLAERRSRAVGMFLAKNRIQSEARVADVDVLPREGIAVVVQRTAVTLPACPNWTQMPNRNFDNQPMSNWSCATAVNFGLMLADPSDLVRGRDPGRADGEALARSVENYRKDKTKDIIRDAASSEIFPAVGPSNSSNSGK
jgi:pilus assembly protein CpaD